MRKNDKSFDYLLVLLESFPPSAWREESYVKSPHFIFENLEGRAVLTPTRRDAEIILDELSRSLSLRKRREDNTYCYVVSKNEVIKALEIFDWFVRRSWRIKEFSIIWALAYVARAKSWSGNVPLGSVAELSGYEPLLCVEVIERLLKTGQKKDVITNGEGYTVSRQQVSMAVKQLLDKIPIWSEELVMNILCSKLGASVEDIYKQVIEHGLSLRTTYKVVEKLKRENYIIRSRYYRVSPRGPMRELLSANCRNCFYGYTSEERCFQDVARQVELFIKRYYGREIKQDDKEAFYKTLKLIPYSSRILRRMLIALRLIYELNSLKKETYLPTMLRRFEEWFGVELGC